jgi:hypothetical protein
MKTALCISVLLIIVVASMPSLADTTSSLSDQTWVVVSLLNQDPDPARAGDTVTIRFKVENLGGLEATDLSTELIQDYPFTVVNGEAVKNLSDLSGYQNGVNYITFEYTAKVDKDAVQGQYQLQLNYKFNNRPWDAITLPIDVVNKEFAQIIYIDKATISPGQETPMKFTITNIGSAPLQNLVFSWQEPTGAILPVYSSDTKYVKYLDVGKSIDLTYTVIADVNANPGLYQLNLILKYESTSNTTANSVTTRAGVFIGGGTDFDVAFSESTAGTTSLSVANTGNNPAQSVSVSIPSQPNFRVSGSNSAIIGNLDKGDYTLVSFPIVQNTLANFTGQRALRNQTASAFAQGAAGRAGADPNSLQVLIEYTDTTGTRRNVTKSVPIQFRTATTGTTGQTPTFSRQGSRSSFIGSSIFWILLIFIVAAGVFVFGTKSRRDKLLKLVHRRK